MSTVSIITVCYNSERYLEQTILSVLKQTYNNIEYILIDGQSTDGTLPIIKKYASLYPHTIRYLSEPDKGIYNAMNKGLHMASGEVVGIINSDDWYEPNAIEQVMTAYQRIGIAVYHGIQRTYRGEEVVGLRCTSANQLTLQMIEHPTCFLPKLLYDKYGTFDESYQYVGDYELMLRLQQKKVPFIRLDEVLANFREGGVSHSFEAVQENYRLWLQMGIQTKRDYVYRTVMDRIKMFTGRGPTSGKKP